METWHDSVFEQPIITPTKYVTYSNKNGYRKVLHLFEHDEAIFISGGKKYRYYYSSTQRKKIAKEPVMAEVRFSMILKGGIGWSNEKINFIFY